MYQELDLGWICHFSVHWLFLQNMFYTWNTVTASPLFMQSGSTYLWCLTHKTYIYIFWCFSWTGCNLKVEIQLTISETNRIFLTDSTTHKHTHEHTFSSLKLFDCLLNWLFFTPCYGFLFLFQGIVHGFYDLFCNLFWSLFLRGVNT